MQSPLAYQSLDIDGRLLEVNQQWLDSLGYTREEVIGKNFAEFLHPDFRDHFADNFLHFKEAGEISGVEFTLVRKDGSLILVSFNGKIGTTTEGFFRQTHCFFQDITRRKQDELV